MTKGLKEFQKGHKSYHTTKSKQKLSKAHKGKQLTKESKDKLSKYWKTYYANGGIHPMQGKHLSQKHKDRIGKFHKGKHHSKESIEKMSRSHKRYYAHGGIHPMQGKQHSAETRKKISESNMGRSIWNKGISWSIEARKKISDTNKRKGIEPKIKFIGYGKDSPRWKGGITPKNHKMRTSSEYKLWRKSVFERDNFICQKTGISGEELNAHHINNFANFPELRTSIENGITLSKKTHKEFHKIYGNKNNTREQLEEFLNN